MRNISSTLQQRLKTAQQTAYKNADPRARILLSRPKIPLTTDQFLEFTTVATLSELQKSDVAIRRCRAGKPGDLAYVAYVANGTAGVKCTTLKGAAPSRVWVSANFSEPAVDIAIAFDGTMPQTRQGNVQFITEDSPWVFWVDADGALYARKLGTDTTHTLAEGNCSAVTAVRAMWSEVGAFDFGLVCFFLLGSTLYYRQLIAGEWTDAELVSFGPEGVTWSSIAAFRTWDYRVGVQALGSDGVVYELFTQFMGIGKLNAEHVEMKGGSSEYSLTHVFQNDAATAEHVEIAGATSGPYRYVIELGAISCISVKNMADDSGDWGRLLVVQFDKELNQDEASAQILQFKLVDSDGVEFYPDALEMDITGKFMTLIYTSFNNATGSCVFSYTPGTVCSMAGELLPAFAMGFNPKGLVPVEGLPEVTAIYNE